jgi:hypothetical protein
MTKMFLFLSMKAVVRRVLPVLKILEFWGDGIEKESTVEYRLHLRQVFDLADPNKLIRLVMRSSVHGSFPTGVRLKKFTKLETLGLRGTLGQPPEELFSLQNLTALSIQSNIGSLSRLTALRINNLNEMGGLEGVIPAQLSKLTRLKVLDISGNRHVTGQLHTMTSLEVLNLCNSGLLRDGDGNASEIFAAYNGSLDYPYRYDTNTNSTYKCRRVRDERSFAEVELTSALRL